MNASSNSNQLNVQRNLNNLHEFNENISQSSKQAEKPRNGYVTPNRENLQTLRSELIIQSEDVPDDILCGPVHVETSEKHSHSKKHKKSKKHKLHDNEDYCNDEEKSTGIHIQPNALATENICVVDSSENLSPAKGGTIPKIILSRNVKDSSKFIVKENLTSSENNLKRRRSTEDNSHTLQDGKRSKSDQKTSNELPVLMIPSIPIKLDRRLSVRLEDAYGKYGLLNGFI